MGRLLLDENLPRLLAENLRPHEVRTVREMQWHGLKNGALLRRAEAEFDVFVTMDRSIPFQQSVRRLDIAVIIIAARSNRLNDLTPWRPRWPGLPRSSFREPS